MPSLQSNAGCLRGMGASNGRAAGKAHVLAAGDDPSVGPGEVAVVACLTPTVIPLLRHAAAVIAETGGVLADAAMIARENGVPTVVNVRGATRRIQSGQDVSVDGGAGTVTLGPPASVSAA